MFQEQLQISNVTSPYRYPQVFGFVSELLNGQGRLLSFGCSIGDEVFTLAERHFDHSTIVGVDISANAVAMAEQRLREPDNPALKPRAADLRDNAISFVTPDRLGDEPFDAVFAMSVLCRWPPGNITETFPYGLFCDVLSRIDALVRPGGYLVLFNTSYHFEATPTAERYTALDAPKEGKQPFVYMFTPEGKRDHTPQAGIVFQKAL